MSELTKSLPAPLSLTLEEASKVAAGSSLSLSAVETWWWKGQPAFAFLNQGVAVAPVSVAVGQLASSFAAHG